MSQVKKSVWIMSLQRSVQADAAKEKMEQTEPTFVTLIQRYLLEPNPFSIVLSGVLHKIVLHYCQKGILQIRSGKNRYPLATMSPRSNAYTDEVHYYALTFSKTCYYSYVRYSWKKRSQTANRGVVEYSVTNRWTSRTNAFPRRSCYSFQPICTPLSENSDTNLGIWDDQEGDNQKT